MDERSYENLLNIKTSGLREWSSLTTQYSRYEPTSYAVLEELIENFAFKKGDHLVDFGSGRGRVAFFLNYKLNLPIVGIEANELTYGEAMNNLYTYKRKHSKKNAPINFKLAFAENYRIKKDQNIFYFFNPFTKRIFKKVVSNILKSYKRHPRDINLIIYYPLEDYGEFLEEKTNFILANSFTIPGFKDNYQKILVYKLHKLTEEE